MAKQVDVDAVERLWSDPRKVVELRELGEYKQSQPRENETIINCYDTRRIVFDLTAEIRELRAAAETAIVDIMAAL